MGDERHRVEAVAKGSTESVADPRAEDRHGRRASDEHDAPDPGLTVGRKEAPADEHRAVDERQGDLVEDRARQNEIDVHGPAVQREQLRKRDGRLRGTGELDLRLFSRMAKLAEGGRVERGGAVDLDPLGILHPPEHPLDDLGVEVAAAEEVVAVVTDDPEEPFARREQRRIERPTAEVVDEPAFVTAVAVR